VVQLSWSNRYTWVYDDVLPADRFSAPGRLGGFTFYAHKQWNAEWGGELLVSDEQGGQTPTPFDNSALSEQLLQRGMGTWIAPKPNRLVL
jgi:hypothetical protein